MNFELNFCHVPIKVIPVVTKRLGTTPKSLDSNLKKLGNEISDAESVV